MNNRSTTTKGNTMNERTRTQEMAVREAAQRYWNHLNQFEMARHDPANANNRTTLSHTTKVARQSLQAIALAYTGTYASLVPVRAFLDAETAIARGETVIFPRDESPEGGELLSDRIAYLVERLRGLI